MERTGFLWIHSAPAALCPHIEWAVGGVFGVPQRFEWQKQPAERASYRCELSWVGNAGTAAALASAFLGWKKLRFEVVEEPVSGLGTRYAYTPSLGLHQSAIGSSGDALVHEERLKSALASDAAGDKRLQESVTELLGTAWDVELDVFRYAGENDFDIRWLNVG